MIVDIHYAEQAPERRSAFWTWCLGNGFVASEVVYPVCVDVEGRTLTIRRTVAVPGPGQPDFPELVRDEFGFLTTVQQVLPLGEDLPDWIALGPPEGLAA